MNDWNQHSECIKNDVKDSNMHGELWKRPETVSVTKKDIIFNAIAAILAVHSHNYFKCIKCKTITFLFTC